MVARYLAMLALFLLVAITGSAACRLPRQDRRYAAAISILMIAALVATAALNPKPAQWALLAGGCLEVVSVAGLTGLYLVRRQLKRYPHGGFSGYAYDAGVHRLWLARTVLVDHVMLLVLPVAALGYAVFSLR
jgi:hypothetical protein